MYELTGYTMVSDTMLGCHLFIKHTLKLEVEKDVIS